jgi:rhodanese-related sulfurtransferase
MKLKTFLIIFTILILALFLYACQSVFPVIGKEVVADGGSYVVVSVQELQAMLEDKDFTMINVHVPWQGDIPHTDLHLPYDQITNNTDQLPSDKDTKILVYCLTSGMAKVSIQSFIDLGYTNVWMLEGGTNAWNEAGLPLIKE